MTLTHGLAAGIAATIALMSGAEAATTQPAAGIYLVNSTVTSAGCGVPIGTTLQGTFFYTGPDRPNAREYYKLGATEIINKSFSTNLPDVGVTTWSGTETRTLHPSGSSTSFAFTRNFTFVDKDSFFSTTSAQPDSCDTAEAYTRSGHL